MTGMQGYPRIPSESEEQQMLMRWAAMAAGAHPELRLLYHVPNGGSRGRPRRDGSARKA